MSGALSVIEAVRRACRESDGQDPLDEATALRLANHGVGAFEVWLEDDGFALGHGTAVDLAVAPTARGRGVGGGLAARAFAGPDPVTAWSHGDHPGAARLAEVHGLRRARELWVMRRAGGVPLPSLATPAGVTIRGYRPQDAADVVRVNAAAFAGHPEQASMDATELAERMSQGWFDPDGLLLAHDREGVLLGFHWTKRHDPTTGEVYVVAVSPAAQGTGLGSALTLAGLEHLHAAGVGEVLLYVESDNAPAIRVYDNLGFGHADADTHVQYRRGGRA
ncbi:MAG: mycothiol synthase [Nocardioides sp.]